VTATLAADFKLSQLLSQPMKLTLEDVKESIKVELQITQFHLETISTPTHKIKILCTLILHQLLRYLGMFA